MRLARLHPAILALCVVLGGLAVGKKAQAAGWVSPSGHSDSENKWTNEANSYDGSTSTYASDTSNRIGYGAWINFTLATPILSDRVRVNADFGYGVVDKVDIDVLRDGQWVDVWEGAVADVQYTEKTFTAGTVSEARFRFHYVATGYYFWLYEFGLWEAPAVINPPTVSTEDPSSIEATTAVFHGKVLDDGGSPCEVRFEYGPDTDFGSQTPWAGSHVSGDTFGKVITGLGSGIVFYRVQARNGEGTIVSGDDKSFATGTPQGGDWRSPTAHTDSSGTWENAEAAYDDETGTCARAYHAIGAGQWSQYLYLTRDALPNARGVRFMAKKDSIIDQISIDVLRNGVWTYVYAGTFSNMVWTTKGFSAGSVTQARVRFKVNSTSSGLYWELHEFDFTENPDLVPQAQSGDRYWIASSAGNWSSTANWSTSSGGAGGASVPGSTHLVHFNGSGLGTCTIDSNANVMGIDITPTFTGTITQANTKTVTVGTLGYGQYGGTFAGGDSLIDCNGNFIVGGGTFTSTTGELRTAMNVTVSGTFAHNNGTVILDGGSKTVSSGSAQFNNVVLNSPGGITVDGTMNIVNLTNTASNSQSTGVFAVSGNLVTTAQSLSSASATVLLNGSGNQTASANGGSGKICRIVVDKPSGVATFLDNLKVVNGFSQLSGTVDASQGTITIADASAVIDTFDMTFGNLVFDTSGSVNISGTARAVNFSNLRSNNISGTLEVSGNVLTTSQSFSGAPGTLVLNGSGDQTISANGGSGKLPSVVIDKSAGGGSVNLQDTLKVVGGWDFQFADGVNAGTSTVEFCGGSASLYGPSMAFATLVLNTQGNLTLDSDLSTTNLQILGANALNGEVIKVSGDVLTTASTMSGASATVRLVGSGTQNVGAGGGAGKLPNFEVDKLGGTANLSDVLQVNGNWGHISGTVNPGTSTVSFVGISTRSISGAAVFNNLMLNRSFIGETVNVESDVSVLGALDVIKGTLAIVEDNTLYVGGDLSIDPTNGNLLANTSTIAFDGTGAQAVDFGGRGVNNLTVSNAGGTVTFTSGVVAAEGSTATFLPGSSLKFANAQVFAFDLIDWKGAAGNPVTLRSDATGMPWLLEAAGYPSATYVDVQDSDASGGETIIATNSNDAGGNTNWAFQGAGLLSITTAATSVTNPAWVEGTSGSDAVSLQIAVDAGDPFNAVRLNPTKWFGDDASAGGASLGLLISATQATHVEVTATDALSNVNSVSQDITWAETDLSGKSYSTDTIRIRRGDSLLLSADGTGTTLEIDGDGDGTYESSGAPGDAFPTQYGTAGTFVARAKIDGAEVGSLTVVVIGVDLHGPVACELNWQRIQDTYVTPVTEVASVAFESANPFALTTSFNQNTATGVRLNLKPLKMGTPQFLARLGSGGPIFGTQEVKVFILKNLNTAIAGVAMDENGFGEGAFRFQVVPPTVIANDNPNTPETEGLFFDFLVTGGFLTVKENGQSSIRVPSTAQDENGLFEIEVLYDPSGTSVCSRIHAVQVNSPDVDAGPEHHANPCITKVCKVVWFQEEVNDETSAADKARQQGNINAHSKRFHAYPPFVPQLEDGQDHTVMWSQGRKFVFVGEPVGSDYFAALISPPKRGPVNYDVMARCEHEHCPRVPPCPQMDDDGASNHRMVSLKSNPKDEVRAEIFYPFLVNEQEVGKATPGPTTFPHGTYFLSPPNWVGYNPGPEPHIDDPQICGPVPCPHPIDTCKKPIPCFGCNEYLVKYVNHWGTFDVHIGPNGVCPKTDSPRIKDAITIIRLEAVGPKENEQQSGGFVGDPDGTVFPDLVGVVDQADIVRIDVSGGESAEVVQVTAPNEGTQSVVPAKTRKGIIENHTNDFTFDAVLDPSFQIPEGATLTYSWDFGDGSTAEGESPFHSYETPGRYNVKLTLTITVPDSDPIVATAELHSFNIIQEECDSEQPHPQYLAEEDRAGVPVRILARGPAGATVNVALHVRRRADIGQKGLGRVSLDGYPEDEYKNGFTSATSAASVEGLTQYYSMTIDGQAHFPPEDGSAGVEAESLGDAEMVTWVVFLQGMGVNDIADNIDLNVLGREVRAKCDSMNSIEPTCECIYALSDTEAFSAIKIVLLKAIIDENTGTFTGNLQEDTGQSGTNAIPLIELDAVSSASVAQDGMTTILISGTVFDPLADLSPTSAKITEVTISSSTGSEPLTAAVTDVGDQENLVRPFAFKGRFSATYTFPAATGENTIYATVANSIGETATDSVAVNVTKQGGFGQPLDQPAPSLPLIIAPRLNIVLAAPLSPTTIDSITAFSGRRPPEINDPTLVETEINSNIFVGVLPDLGAIQIKINEYTGVADPDITGGMCISFSSTALNLQNIGVPLIESTSSSNQFEHDFDLPRIDFSNKFPSGLTVSIPKELSSQSVDTITLQAGSTQVLSLEETTIASREFSATDPTLGSVTLKISAQTDFSEAAKQAVVLALSSTGLTLTESLGGLTETDQTETHILFKLFPTFQPVDDGDIGAVETPLAFAAFRLSQEPQFSLVSVQNIDPENPEESLFQPYLMELTGPPDVLDELVSRNFTIEYANGDFELEKFSSPADHQYLFSHSDKPAVFAYLLHNEEDKVPETTTEDEDKVKTVKEKKTAPVVIRRFYPRKSVFKSIKALNDLKDTDAYAIYVHEGGFTFPQGLSAVSKDQAEIEFSDNAREQIRSNPIVYKQGTELELELNGLKIESQKFSGDVKVSFSAKVRTYDTNGSPIRKDLITDPVSITFPGKKDGDIIDNVKLKISMPAGLVYDPEFEIKTKTELFPKGSGIRGFYNQVAKTEIFGVFGKPEGNIKLSWLEYDVNHRPIGPGSTSTFVYIDPNDPAKKYTPDVTTLRLRYALLKALSRSEVRTNLTSITEVINAYQDPSSPVQMKVNGSSKSVRTYFAPIQDCNPFDTRPAKLVDGTSVPDIGIDDRSIFQALDGLIYNSPPENITSSEDREAWGLHGGVSCIAEGHLAVSLLDLIGVPGLKEVITIPASRDADFESFDGIAVESTAPVEDLDGNPDRSFALWYWSGWWNRWEGTVVYDGKYWPMGVGQSSGPSTSKLDVMRRVVETQAYNNAPRAGTNGDTLDDWIVIDVGADGDRSNDFIPLPSP